MIGWYCTYYYLEDCKPSSILTKTGSLFNLYKTCYNMESMASDVLISSNLDQPSIPVTQLPISLCVSQKELLFPLDLILTIPSLSGTSGIQHNFATAFCGSFYSHLWAKSILLYFLYFSMNFLSIYCLSSLIHLDTNTLQANFISYVAFMALQKIFLAFSKTFDSVIYLPFDCFVVLLTDIFLFTFSWQFFCS